MAQRQEHLERRLTGQVPARVADDADHCHRKRRLAGALRQHQLPAERAAVTEGAPGQRLVDHGQIRRHGRRRRGFVVREPAPLQHPQAQDVEVLRPDAVRMDADRAGAAGRGIRDVHREVRSEHARGERRHREPGRGDDAIEGVAVVGALRLLRVALPAGVELVHGDVVRIEAEIVGHHALQRDDEHERAGEQRHRQRQLGGGEHAANTPAACGDTCARLQQCRRSSAAGRGGGFTPEARRA